MRELRRAKMGNPISPELNASSRSFGKRLRSARIVAGYADADEIHFGDDTDEMIAALKRDIAMIEKEYRD